MSLYLSQCVSIYLKPLKERNKPNQLKKLKEPK